MKSQKNDKDKKINVLFKAILHPFFLSFLLALVVRTFLYKTYRVTGNGMSDIISPGNTLIVQMRRISLPSIFNTILKRGGRRKRPLYSLPLPGSFFPLHREKYVLVEDPRDNAIGNINIGKPVLLYIMGEPSDQISIKDSCYYIGEKYFPSPFESKKIYKVFALYDKIYLLKKIFEKNNCTYQISRQKKYSIKENRIQYVIKEITVIASPTNFSLALQKSSDFVKYHYDEKTIISKRDKILFDYYTWEELEGNYTNMKPVKVPYKGYKIKINKDNIKKYLYTIRFFEGYANVHPVQKQGKWILYIDGIAFSSYTFKKNYYFLIQHNRNAFYNSKAFGFIPEDLITGKVVKKLDTEYYTNIPFLNMIISWIKKKNTKNES